MGKRILEKPPVLNGRQIKALREKWGLNQSQFAQLLNVPPKTIREWEQQTRRNLEGPVLRLIQSIKAELASQKEGFAWREFNRIVQKLYR